MHIESNCELRALPPTSSSESGDRFALSTGKIEASTVVAPQAGLGAYEVKVVDDRLVTVWSGEGGQVDIFDLETFELITTIPFLSPIDVAFFASCFVVHTDESAELYSLQSGTFLRTLDCGPGIHHCIIDEWEVVQADDGVIEVYSLKEGELKGRFEGDSPDAVGRLREARVEEGRLITLMENEGITTVQEWGIESGERMASLELPSWNLRAGHQCLEWYVDGRVVLPSPVGDHSVLEVWDLERGKQIESLLEHQGRITHIVDAGDKLVTADATGLVIVRDPENLQEVRRIQHDGEVDRLEVIGELIAIIALELILASIRRFCAPKEGEKQVSLYNMETGEQTTQFVDRVAGLAGDGERIFIAREDEGIALWQGKPLGSGCCVIL